MVINKELTTIKLHPMKKLLATLILLTSISTEAISCNSDYNINLETFGEGVLVELRIGRPGASKVARATRSSGGLVSFSGLCAGNYFIAIGNEEYVSVGPIRDFDGESIYNSRIVLQRGTGNLTKQARKSL